MPAATPDPRPAELTLSGQLDALSRLLGQDVTTEVVGLEPHAAMAVDLSRADALVLVGGPDAGSVVDALHAVQTDARWRVTAAGLDLWRGLGRPPQAGFVVHLPLTRPVPRPAVPVVQHRLDVVHKPIPEPAGAVPSRSVQSRTASPDA